MLTECFKVLLVNFPPFCGVVELLDPACQDFLALPPGLLGGGIVEFLGDRLGGCLSYGEEGVSMPALTGDWLDFTLRNLSVSLLLGGLMTDMSPTNGMFLALPVKSTSIGSS